jgi:hypothetical protein
MSTRKMKDGYFAEDGKASSFVGNTIRCEVCGKELTHGKSKAIHTYSSSGVFGRKNQHQYCSWKCAEKCHYK